MLVVRAAVVPLEGSALTAATRDVRTAAVEKRILANLYLEDVTGDVKVVQYRGRWLKA